MIFIPFLVIYTYYILPLITIPLPRVYFDTLTWGTTCKRKESLLFQQSEIKDCLSICLDALGATLERRDKVAILEVCLKQRNICEGKTCTSWNFLGKSSVTSGHFFHSWPFLSSWHWNNIIFYSIFSWNSI